MDTLPVPWLFEMEKKNKPLVGKLQPEITVRTGLGLMTVSPRGSSRLQLTIRLANHRERAAPARARGATAITSRKEVLPQMSSRINLVKSASSKQAKSPVQRELRLRMLCLRTL